MIILEIPLRVHICLVGFEVERISKAALERKADRVYLITKHKDDKGRVFFDKNKEILEKHNVEVIGKFIDDIVLEDILKVTKEIIKNENTENTIYINISSGSTLAAISGMLCSMMYSTDKRIIPYYVKAKDYLDKTKNEDKEKITEIMGKNYGGTPPITSGILAISDILTFPMSLPSNELLIFLKEIQKEKDGISISALIEFSKTDDNIAKFRELTKRNDIKESSQKTKQSEYAWINQNILKKLRDEWELITIEKRGRNHFVKINEKGEKMLKYLC